MGFDWRRVAEDSVGPVKRTEDVNVAVTAHTDPQGFIFHAYHTGTAALSYPYRSAEGGTITLSLNPGDYPQVAGIPVLCVSVGPVAGGRVLVGNL